jgi:L-seryl-tRNA(Ser) seleniumtransferase
MASRAPALRALPAVESVLRRPEVVAALVELPRGLVVEAVRAELAEARARLRRDKGRAPDAATVAAHALVRAREERSPALRRVLNATGVVLHTNLGRAPLSRPAQSALGDVARGYSSLEFDLDTGRRGERGLGVERWLTRLTGAESALVVNNGAAAVLLVLSALASGRRVVVSRGELVEIGGSFRIPEILEKSGARLEEIGTTNRTHLRDYAKALERHDDVAAVLRVHPSNFRVAGFTTRPALDELAKLAHRHRVPLIEDLGSGALVDLEPLGLEREPTVRESLTAGCDVVTFSGDKLLGAPQAGLILGRKRWVDRARRDPLARALRVDKLTLAALEATLPAFLDPARAVSEIPALAMLHTTSGELEARARRLQARLERGAPEWRVSVEPGDGEVGGGALPLQRLSGWVVGVEWPGQSAGRLDEMARRAEPPVIGYLRGGKFRLDVRTLSDDDIDEAADALLAARGHEPRTGSDAGSTTRGSRTAERE